MTKTSICWSICIGLIFLPICSFGQAAIDASAVIYSDKVEFLGSPLFRLTNEKTFIDRYLAPIAGIAGTIIGASITIAIKYFDKRSARREQEIFVATSLLDEIANRAARCAFDYETPWSQYTPNQKNYKPRDLQKVLKFLPNAPIMYPALANQIAILDYESRTAITTFYAKLDDWHREIEDTYRLNYKADTPNPQLPKGVLFRLSRRLGETLEPAKIAIEKVSAYVPDGKKITKANFINLYRTSVVGDRANIPEKEEPYETLDRLIRYAWNAKKAEQKIETTI